MPAARGRGEGAVAADLNGQRGARQRDDDLDELPGGTRRRGSSSARKRRQGAGDGERERKERAPQEARMVVREDVPADWTAGTFSAGEDSPSARAAGSC